MEIKLRGYQDKFIFSKARFPALVAGIGTGKSMCGIIRVMSMLEQYPGNLGLIVRKEFTDLRDSTLKDFETYTGLKVRQDKNVVLPNGSTLMFRHGSEINVLKNINLGVILIEQAEEFDSDETFIFLRDRLRRANVADRSMAVIANTNGHNWIYKLWKVNAAQDPDFELIEATTFDNEANLPADYIADQRKMETTHPGHFRRYVLNSWAEEDTYDSVISPLHIDRARARVLSVKYPIRRVMGIDVARFGNDKTVFCGIENNVQIYHRTIEKKDTMETVGHAVMALKELKTRDVAVDEIGVGGGVGDRLQELGYNVIFVNSSKASIYPDQYYNLRAEIYGYGKDQFSAGNVQLLAGDDDTAEQLGWSRYTMKSRGQIIIEPKDKIKERYGRSPDDADAFLIALWALPQVPPTEKRDKYAEHRYRPQKLEFNPNVV